MADGLTPVGVELVAEGSPAFTTAVNKAAASLGVLERAGKAAAAGINVVDQMVIGALRRIGELGVNALVRAGRELVQFGAQTLEAATQGSQLNRTLDTLGERLLRIIRFNIDPLLNQFDGLVQRTTPAIEGWVAAISREFSQVGQNALTWGENIATQFAQGIYDGAQAVLDALIYIGNLITSWLMPGSPPKLLPNLDDWGTEAANVYLAGWTKADFGIFATIGSQIESLLRSQGGKNDTGLIPRILGTREAIAAAVEQARTMGQVTAEALDHIYQAAGAVTPEIQTYLRSVFQLDLANAGLTAAQEALNRETEKYQELLKPVDAQLARISESQQQFVEDQEKSRLALILQDPNVTAGEKRQAQLRMEEIAAERNRRALIEQQGAAVDAAQANVAAAQEVVTAAQAQYDAERERLEVLTEQNRLIQEQASLLDRIAATMAKAVAAGGGKGGGGVVPLKVEIPQEILDKIQALQDKIAILRAAWQLAWALIRAAMEPVRLFLVNELMPLLTTLWGIISTEGGKSIAILQTWWNGTLMPMLRIAWTWTKENLGPVFKDLWTSLKENGPVAIQFLANAWNMILLPAILNIAAWVLILNGLAFANAWAWMKEKLPGAIETLTTALDNLKKAGDVSMAAFGSIVITTMANIVIEVQRVIDFVNGLISLLASIAPGIAAVTGGAAAGNFVSPPASGGYSTANNATTYVGPTYNYNASYNGAPASPTMDFAAMQVWGAN